MYINITLEEAFEIIGKFRSVRKDIVVPSSFPLVPNNLYKTDYEWLFSYERKLCRFLKRWIIGESQELFGLEGIITEGISNAYVHGNKRNRLLPITIDVYEGKLGIVISIKDEGNGFDFENFKRRFKKGKRYFTLAGNGSRVMFASKNFGIFYTNGGNEMNLLYPLKKLKEKLFSKTSENLEAQIAASTAKEIDQNKVVENIGKREEKQPKEKKLFLVPPLKTDLWLQSVVLADINGEPLAAIGIEANKAKQCATHCKDLVIASEKIAKELAIGIPRKIFSSTSKQMLSVNLYPKERRILIALLCEDATMILARKSIDEAFEYLNETVAKQKKL